MKIQGKIEKAKKEQGTSKQGKPYTRVVYTIQGKDYSTFDVDLMEFKEGDEVEMETEQKGIYQNMVSMKKVAVNGSKSENKPIQEFHQSEEAIRYEALDIALKHLAFKGGQPDINNVTNLADVYVLYLKTGLKKFEKDDKT